MRSFSLRVVWWGSTGQSVVPHCGTLGDSLSRSSQLIISPAHWGSIQAGQTLTSFPSIPLPCLPPCSCLSLSGIVVCLLIEPSVRNVMVVREPSFTSKVFYWWALTSPTFSHVKESQVYASMTSFRGPPPLKKENKERDFLPHSPCYVLPLSRLLALSEAA